MSNTQEIIARARQLAAQGGLWNVLLARDLLLEPGFIRHKDGLIQAEFFRLFPPSKELAHELATSLTVVLQGDLEARRNAATYLEKQPRRSITGQRQGWLKDPRTIEVLCQALQDSDPAVVDKVVGCLGGIADRYGYVDLAVFAQLAALFEAAHPGLRVTIASALCPFPTHDRWPFVVRALQGKRTHMAKMLLGFGIAAYGADMPEPTKQTLREILLEILERETNGNVFHRLVGAMETIGDLAATERLRRMRLPPRCKELKADVARAIATIVGRSEAGSR